LPVVRSFQSDDLVAYVQLVNAIDRVDGLGKATSLAHARERLWEPGFRPEADLFLAYEGGRLVGYVETWSELEIGRVVLDGAVHPSFRRRGVGSALLETAVERGVRLDAEVAHVPVASVIEGTRNFLEKRGFGVVHEHWHMALVDGAPSPPAPPRGFEVRPFAAGDEAELCALQNEAFADHWGFRPNSVEQVGYLVNTSLCHHEGILFVCEGGKGVAYCWTADDAADREKGYVRMIGVVPAYRGRGLGRLALVAAIRYLTGRGLRKIELLVDSTNEAAIGLYRSLGFRKGGETLWYERGLGCG